MILGLLDDRVLRDVLRRAARVDEEVVFDTARIEDALTRGRPRLLVRLPEVVQEVAAGPAGRPPVLTIGEDLVRRWERRRRDEPVPRPRAEAWAECLRPLLEERGAETRAIDRFLSELGRAVGAPLPLPLRTLARHVLEYPAGYLDLGDLAGLAGLSRGALKGRFRRRGLESPCHWARWLRVVAVAEVLSDPMRTTADAAVIAGVSHSGNLCRFVQDVSGRSPSDLRRAEARPALVADLARQLLAPPGLSAWEDLSSTLPRSGSA